MGGGVASGWSVLVMEGLTMLSLSVDLDQGGRARREGGREEGRESREGEEREDGEEGERARREEVRKGQKTRRERAGREGDTGGGKTDPLSPPITTYN